MLRNARESTRYLSMVYVSSNVAAETKYRMGRAEPNSKAIVALLSTNWKRMPRLKVGRE